MNPAASHPSSSADESTVPQWTYDVFLNFRGEVRTGIISHLYDELQKTNVNRTFMDDKRLQVGDAIAPCLWRAIEESRFAIVVLSENYASSSWCLEELKHIIQCMEGEDRILPLFYNVDPFDVRKKTGRFGIPLTENEKKSTLSQEKVKQWRVALEMVSNHSGWDARNFRSERELVKRIVKDVCSKTLQSSVKNDFDESRGEILLERNHFKVGPFGSHKGGKLFDDGACYSAVKQLMICYAKKWIMYIKVEYVDLDGTSVWSDEHGSRLGECRKVEMVTLNYPDEYLTSIHGIHNDSWYSPTQIVSLTFHSNKRVFGPFGDVSRGTSFSIEEVPGSQIVGYFGRYDHFLGIRAMGTHLKPIPNKLVHQNQGPCARLFHGCVDLHFFSSLLYLKLSLFLISMWVKVMAAFRYVSPSSDCYSRLRA